MPDNKPREKSAEVLRRQNQAKVDELEQKFGVVVDITNVTLGQLARLAREKTSFDERLDIMQSLLSQGSAENIKLLELEEFMDLVSLKVELATNPT